MKQYIYLLLTFAALVGCGKEALDNRLSDNNSQITFGVIINDGFPQSQLKTRGTPNIGSTAFENKKIKVLAIDKTSDADAKRNFASLLSKNGDIWLADTVRYYDALTYDFHAYASDLEITEENSRGISISNDEVPVISYIVPLDVTNQPDILIGDMVESKSSGKISLSMHHALSCVGFVATSKHTGNIRKVKSVTLKNVYGAGSTTLTKKNNEPIEWKVSGSADIQFSAAVDKNQPLDDKFEDISNKLTYLMQGNGFLMMVPQVLEIGAQIVMEIWDGTNETSIHKITYNIPPTTWLPGKKYIYYFDEPVLEGVATYYERYAEDGSLGLYYYDNGKEEFHLKDNMTIIDAGYGLLVPASTYTQYPSIYLGLAKEGDDPKDISNSDGSIAATLTQFGGVECVLYPLSQNLYPYSRTATKRTGFQPYNTDKPVQIESGVSETGSGKPINTHGYILPHYAKGIYKNEDIPNTHFIRTPIQMRNISYQTNDSNGGATTGKTYIQEFTKLNFSLHSNRLIYGKDLKNESSYKESIVIGGFGGTYGTENTKSIISGLVISTPSDYQYDAALFENIIYGGKLLNIETDESCIYVYNNNGSISIPRYFAGIAAVNSGTIDGAVNGASITSYSDNDVRVGGVAGHNIYRVKNSLNKGVINNQGKYLKSVTGGVVAWNEKFYLHWYDIKPEDKDRFRAIHSKDFTESMIDTYPGAIVLNCENRARVIGGSRVGGIAAINAYGGVIYECVNGGEVRNNGKLTEEIVLGGIVGLQTGGLENTPLTNPNKTDPPKFICTIQNCTNTANITATSGIFNDKNRAVGGIVGINDFATAEGEGREIEAYGHVNQCVVNGARISSFYSDTGGVVGLNSGNVNRSRCDDVYVTGVFGNGEEKKRNSAGGIVGTNNFYVSDCLFTHSSTTSSPISSEPSWIYRSSSGGIVGINNTPDNKLKSPSGFIQRCLFAAIAPVARTVGGEIGTFAPIAGWSGGYLFRNYNGEPNLKLKENAPDVTTGATPLYTIQDNYYASGVGVNLLDANINFPNEPDVEKIVIAPFADGRYPYGQARISREDLDILPLTNWFGAAWSDNRSGKRPPVVPKWYGVSYSLPSNGLSANSYVMAGISRAIKEQTGAVNYTALAWGFASIIRVSLNNLTDADLNGVESIRCDFSFMILLPNTAGQKGYLFVRAPNGWKFDNPNNNPKSYTMEVLDKSGVIKETYHYCLITDTTGRVIKMTK